MLNKNERHGKLDQVKGQIKQAVGTVTGNERLKAEGKADEAIGKVEETVGRVTRKTGDAIEQAVKATKH
ncbi:MAG: CsbD family protein [Vicinamibacterales bacterium]